MFVKINEVLYPATIRGKMVDTDWDGRKSKSITLEIGYYQATKLFVNGLKWSIVQRQELTKENPIFATDEEGNYILDDRGQPLRLETETSVEIKETEFDNSDYCLAGDITDHRDGTITVKMGKLTDLEEAYEIMFGGI